MTDLGLPNQTAQKEPIHTSGNGGVVALEPTYVPNTIPLKTRIWNIALSVALLVYGTYGVVTDNFVLPAKRGTLTLYGYPAWVMYGALLCLMANLAAVVVDHYDTRDNETRYKAFETFARRAGWTLYVAALILGFVKHTQDYVCENIETLRVPNGNGDLTAIAFNRYCALHSPSNAVEPLLQVTVVPSTSALPTEFGNAVLMHQTDIARMYCNGNKLVIEYRPRQNAKGAKILPTVKGGAPVPVEFINASPNPAVQRTLRDKAAQRP
jgi:hypothetical protein